MGNDVDYTTKVEIIARHGDKLINIGELTVNVNKTVSKFGYGTTYTCSATINDVKVEGYGSDATAAMYYLVDKLTIAVRE